MKKLLLIIITISLLLGCSKEEQQNSNNIKNNTESTQQEQTDKQEQIEEEKIDIGMYLYTNEDRILLDNYETDFILNQDLLSVEVYNTTKTNLGGAKQKEVWHEYYDKYQDLNPKIAYHIKFSTTDNGTIEKTIYSPEDTTQIYDYMQIYLYDDINQLDNTTYTHIEEEQVNEDTILTSIKLTGSTKTDNINSDIELSAFMYTNPSTDINDTNNKYTITISRK